jgi:hypothetical protein
MDYIRDKCIENKNLKYLITQKYLLDYKTLHYLGKIIVECSWTNTCSHHVYSNTIKNKKIEEMYNLKCLKD